MTNNEYTMLGMTHHMLRELRAHRLQQAELLALEREPPPVYPTLDNEVLSYPLFTNPGCTDLPATELLSDSMTEEQCRRWRFFYTPDPDKLPHESHWERLNQQLAELKHRYRTATAPRLVALVISIFAIMLLVARGHFMLPIIPITALAAYWFHSETQLRKARQALIVHLQEMEKLYTQRETIQHQLDSLPPPADVDDMQTCYTHAVDKLLQNTLAQLLPFQAVQNPADALHKHYWQGFITESWAYQQLPLHTTGNLTQVLLDEKNRAMLALHPDSRGRHSLFRLQYLHVWVLTERGVLSGEAYYDRVADAFLYEQHELLPYSDIRRIYLVEQALPDYPALKTLLPDSLHKRYLRQPLGVLSMETVSGKVHNCVLPLHNTPQQSDEWEKSLGVKTDMTELNRQLHSHILPVVQAA